MGSEPFPLILADGTCALRQCSSQRGLNSIRGPSLPPIPFPRLKHKQIHCIKARPVASVVETSGMDNRQDMAYTSYLNVKCITCCTVPAASLKIEDFVSEAFIF